jgi:hypothetical protein
MDFQKIKLKFGNEIRQIYLILGLDKAQIFFEIIQVNNQNLNSDRYSDTHLA